MELLFRVVIEFYEIWDSAELLFGLHLVFDEMLKMADRFTYYFMRNNYSKALC